MATRKDIADRVGVSVSVVSRALNNSGYVQADKREQILQAARELGYGREPVGLQQSARNSKRVAVYSINTRNPFYVEFALGVRSRLAQAGYDMILVSLPFSDGAERYASEGLIFMNAMLAYEYMNTAGKNDFRPAVVASFGEAVRIPRHAAMVQCDLWDGAGKVIRYLRDRGHRKIAMVSPFSRRDQDARIQAWTAEMLPVFGERIDQYYLEVSDAARSMIAGGSLVGGADPTELTREDFFENGVLAAREFVRAGSDATAVICFNEEMGIGFCKTLRRENIRVPKDISVIAYDGTYLRRYMEQPLTVLSLQPYQMGRYCADAVVQMIQGEKPRNRKLRMTEILEGETVETIKGL